MSAGRRYQPYTLQRLGERTVNRNVRTRGCIVELGLPKVLERSLMESYLDDNYWNMDYEPTQYYVDICNTLTFSKQWLSVTPDIFLTLMNWRDSFGWPSFAYESNLIRLSWFEEYEENNTGVKYHTSCKRYCDTCKLSLTRYSRCNLYDKVHGANLMDEIVQLESSWCHGCKTTALFRIEDYETHSPARIRGFFDLVIPIPDYVSSTDEEESH